ncbi:MAG: protein-disulfide reductase DsbD family protein [Salibacter sp.]|nr:protein-disulfide reductase DsbD domain-containing protein [Salibacter sp.]MDR9487136.1 protein-disulfide reductase DsbD family protein [Salibacter sp.]
MLNKLSASVVQRVLVLLFAISASITQAQIMDPVEWSFRSEPVGNGEFDLYFESTIDEGWHLYGNDIPEGGPIPTTFMFEESSGYELVGDLVEPSNKIVKDDPVFMMELTYFEEKAVFKHRVKLKEKTANIKGELEFMVCDEARCLPPELVSFDFDLKKGDSPASKAANQAKQKQPEKETDDEGSDSNDDGILKPITWEWEMKSLGDNEFELIAHAKIKENWHLYTMDLPEGDGPVATEFTILDSNAVELIGEPQQIGEKVNEYDPNFMMDLSFFKKEATIKQRVKLLKEKADVRAEVYFMTCDDKRCLPPEGIVNKFTLEATAEVEESGKAETSSGSEEKDKRGEKEKDGSLWGIFFLSFLGGFAALLTPCVFPMIPMTVSFFTKQSKTRAKGITNAIIYALFIIAVYTILGFLITWIFGADALNAMSTNEWFNLIFFLLLIIFAVSFLGAFEITLPSSWVNKADQASDRGGLLGIFFMALTLSLVSFSCTGPIIGTLLVDAAVYGGVSGPLVGMFGFSLALALPFALFAAFPGWLNSMPKSGGWLNSVKVVLGFLELGLAFKFLSNADLVLQLGIITREVFIAIWIGVSTMLTLYLLGFIRLPHDSPIEKLSVGRTLLGTLFLMFTIYLIPGMWGAPLKLISGFPPPQFYSESPEGVGKESTVMQSVSDNGAIPEGADPEHCPHNLNCFHDYETGMEYAQEVGKPVMLDFTGWACVNCRKMEEQVWSDPRVLDRLRNDFVLISLYVDERKELPEEERYTSETTGKKVRTVGNKWSDFQASRFGTNSQPYYVVIDHEGNQLIESAAYDPDIEKYINWLDKGKKTFEAEGVKK